MSNEVDTGSGVDPSGGREKQPVLHFCRENVGYSSILRDTLMFPRRLRSLSRDEQEAFRSGIPLI